VIIKEKLLTNNNSFIILEADLSILRSGKAKGVRVNTINKICRHLGCDVGDVLKFDGTPEGNDEE